MMTAEVKIIKGTIIEHPAADWLTAYNATVFIARVRAALSHAIIYKFNFAIVIGVRYVHIGGNREVRTPFSICVPYDTVCP
jgi:hypothetical protein